MLRPKRDGWSGALAFGGCPLTPVTVSRASSRLAPSSRSLMGRHLSTWRVAVDNSKSACINTMSDPMKGLVRCSSVSFDTQTRLCSPPRSARALPRRHQRHSTPLLSDSGLDHAALLEARIRPQRGISAGLQARTRWRRTRRDPLFGGYALEALMNCLEPP